MPAASFGAANCFQGCCANLLPGLLHKTVARVVVQFREKHARRHRCSHRQGRVSTGRCQRQPLAQQTVARGPPRRRPGLAHNFAKKCVLCHLRPHQHGRASAGRRQRHALARQTVARCLPRRRSGLLHNFAEKKRVSRHLRPHRHGRGLDRPIPVAGVGAADRRMESTRIIAKKNAPAARTAWLARRANHRNGARTAEQRRDHPAGCHSKVRQVHR
jgi:hypothetical protein